MQSLKNSCKIGKESYAKKGNKRQEHSPLKNTSKITRSDLFLDQNQLKTSKIDHLKPQQLWEGVMVGVYVQNYEQTHTYTQWEESIEIE